MSEATQIIERTTIRQALREVGVTGLVLDGGRGVPLGAFRGYFWQRLAERLQALNNPPAAWQDDWF